MSGRTITAAALLLSACTGHAPPTDTTAAAATTVLVAPAVHAPLVPVPWWRVVDGPPDDALCRRLHGVDDTPADGGLTPALLTVERRVLRLAGAELLVLADGALPPGSVAGHRIAALDTALAAAVERHQAVLSACGRPDDPIDLLVAVSPGVPLSTLVDILFTSVRAGVDRHFLVVVGGSHTPATFAEPYRRDEAAVRLRRADAWRVELHGEREPRTIAALTDLPAALAGRGIGCADLEAGDASLDELVRDLDVLAGLGARRLGISVEPAAASTRADASAAGAYTSVRVGGAVPALPLIPPRFFPDDGDDARRQLHPCEGFYALRATPPSAPARTDPAGAAPW